MSQMLILHLIYFPEMLVSGWRYYRLVSWLQEKNQSLNPSTNPHERMEESITKTQCSIDQGSVRKSPLTKKESITLTKCPIDQGSVRKSSLTKQKILDVYADVFDGLGTFPGEPYRFKLKDNYVPARHAPRKVPIHLQDDFHEEIHDLVKQGVLEKVEYSTEWVNSFVMVEKDVSIDSRNSHAPHHQPK